MKIIASMPFVYLVSLLFLIASTLPAAQTKSKQPAKRWAQEPTSFVGITLGKPMRDSVPIECPTKIESQRLQVDQNALDQASQICWDSTFRLGLRVLLPRNLAVPMLFNEFYIVTDNDDRANNVDAITARFNRSNFPELELMFIEKYGKAHKASKEIVQSQGGATFENQIRDWIGSDISIRLESLNSREIKGVAIQEYGSVRVTTYAYARKSLESAHETAKQGAGKL